MCLIGCVVLVGLVEGATRRSPNPGRTPATVQVDCPVDFIDMGNFCIEPEPRPAANWLEANESCAGEGYSLCRTGQLVAACQLVPSIQAQLPEPPGPPATPYQVWKSGGEWVDGFNHPSSPTGVDSRCWPTIGGILNTIDTNAPGTPPVPNTVQPFRCCADKRLSQTPN